MAQSPAVGPARARRRLMSLTTPRHIFERHRRAQQQALSARQEEEKMQKKNQS